MRAGLRHTRRFSEHVSEHVSPTAAACKLQRLQHPAHSPRHVLSLSVAHRVGERLHAVLAVPCRSVLRDRLQRNAHSFLELCGDIVTVLP